MRAVLLVEVEEVSGMLEVVRVDLAGFDNLVGQHVIGEGLDIQLIAQLFHKRGDKLQDDNVRHGGRSDGNLFQRESVRRAKHERQGQNESKQFLHGFRPP